jgi:hypothetical protein
MKTYHLIAFALSCFSFSANALENQFICTFGNAVKIASKNTTNPQPIVDKSKSDRFTFVIDSVSPFKASYINLNNGLKIPLHAKKMEALTFLLSQIMVEINFLSAFLLKRS